MQCTWFGPAAGSLGESKCDTDGPVYIHMLTIVLVTFVMGEWPGGEEEEEEGRERAHTHTRTRTLGCPRDVGKEAPLQQ